VTCHCEDIAQLQGEVAELIAALPAAHALLQPNETLSAHLGHIVDSIPSSATDCFRTIIQNAAELHMTLIGDNVFEGCTSLKQITIPASVTTVGKDAFKGTLWANTVEGKAFIKAHPWHDPSQDPIDLDNM